MRIVTLFRVRVFFLWTMSLLPWSSVCKQDSGIHWPLYICGDEQMAGGTHTVDGLNVISLLLRRKGKGSAPHWTCSLLSPELSPQGPAQHILPTLGSAYTQHLLLSLYQPPQIQPNTRIWDLSSFNPILHLVPCTYTSELPFASSTVSHQSAHCSPHGL